MFLNSNFKKPRGSATRFCYFPKCVILNTEGVSVVTRRRHEIDCSCPGCNDPILNFSYEDGKYTLIAQCINCKDWIAFDLDELIVMTLRKDKKVVPVHECGSRVH
jgi:hypothetical protein